jgi:molybdopterin/thiamine biosynthesis adenylyltransferase
MDYSRQSRTVDSSIRDKSILVVGCGAIGRNIIMQAAYIGVPNITIFDHDNVELHNVSSQGFPMSDVGMSKVQSIKSELNNRLPTTQVCAYNHKWVPHYAQYDYVFLAADCMSARKNISRFYHRRRKKCAVIDSRMRGEEARVLMTYDRLSRNHYGTTLFSNDEAVDGSCTSSTNIYCSFNTASRAIQCMVAHNRKGYIRPDVLMNMGNGLTFDMTQGESNE